MNDMLVRGAGGGKGGMAGLMGIEEQDTLCSQAWAQVLDLISEGEIEGLVNGLMSVYLSDTPIQNPDGTFNYLGATLATANGTQDQEFLPGFSDVESEVAVGETVLHSTPLIRTITDPNVNAVRVRVSVPQLAYQNKQTGEVSGSSVSYKVEVDNGNGFHTVPLQHLSTNNNVTRDSDTQLTSKTPVNGFTLVANWMISTKQSLNNEATYQVQVRNNDAGTDWTTYTTITQAGLATSGKSSFLGGTDTIMPHPQAVNVMGLPLANYSIRLIPLSGPGSVVFAATDTTGTGVTSTAQVEDTINGKTMVKYERAYTIPLTGSAPWTIRLTRTSPNATDRYTTNDLTWESYTEITYAKLRYPNSALVGLKLDSKYFSSVPTRGYHIKGIRIQIPSNYDPVARTYSGAWDGTFKVAWSNNPAWIYYDMLINDRYGAGSRIKPIMVDKWALYSIGQYCDEMVSDGFGGTEPRFTCNLALQSQADAYKVFADLTSVFRAMNYWATGSVIAVQDNPKDVTAQFARANVIDGQFQYAGSALKARHSVALVTWNNPQNMYRQEVEYVPDDLGIQLYGIRETQVVAFGCSSRGQAHRLGRWLLYSERMETETVAFKVMAEGLLTAPGQLFAVADPKRAGAQTGGRILAGATTSLIPLDRPVTLKADTQYTLSLRINGVLTNASVVLPQADMTSNEISLAAPLAAVPDAGAVWTLSEPNLETQLFRCITVNEDKGIYTVNGLSHDPNKFAQIEDNLAFEPRKISLPNTGVVQPTGLTVNEYQRSLTSGTVNFMTISCDAQPAAVKYQFAYRVNGGNWTALPDTANNNVDVDNVAPGQVDVRVIAISVLGLPSPPAYYSTAIQGKTEKPNGLTSLTATGDVFQMLLKVAYPDDADLAFGEIWYGTSNDRTQATLLTALPFPQTDHIMAGLAAGVTFYFWGRTRDTSGNYSDFYPADNAGIAATTTSDPAKILALLDNAITLSQLASDLQKDISNVQVASGIVDQVNTLAGQIEQNANSMIDGWLQLNTGLDNNRLDQNHLSNLDGQILTLNSTVTDEQSARQSLAVTVGNLSSDFSAEQSARISADQANSQAITSLSSTVDSNKASADQSIATLSSTTSSQAQTLSSLQSSVNSNTANLSSESQTRANADSSLSARVDTLVASSGGNTSGLDSETQARINGDNALTDQITSLTTTVNNNNSTQSANLTTEQQTRANGDSANAASITSLQGTVSTNNSNTNARIDSVLALNVGASTALMTRFSNLDATISGNNSTALGKISDITNLNLTGTTALMQRFSGLDATISSNNNTQNAQYAAILNLSLAGSTALMTKLNSLQASVNSNASSISTEQTARASGDSANATSINNLSATVNNQSASISSNASAIASLQNGQTNLNAQYTLKVDSYGHIAGIGLASSGSSSSNATSTVLIYADKIGFLLPGASAGASPLPVFASGYVNGVATTGINGATFIDGSITAKSLSVTDLSAISANLGSIQVDSAHIANAAVNTLQLAGQAVTIPVSAYTSSAQGGISQTSGVYSTIQQLSFTSSGAPVSVFANTVITPYGGTAPSGSVYFRIVRDSTVIYSTTLVPVVTQTINTDGTAIDHTHQLQFSAVLSDVPGAGLHTYYLQCYIYPYSTNWAAVNTSLMTLETKR